MRITDAEYQQLLARRTLAKSARSAQPTPPTVSPEPVKRRGRMNKLESDYERELAVDKRAGVIRWYGFEAMKFRLADGTYFTPDFAVINDEGSLELRETKGHWREAARLRIKVAADLYPFRFVGVRRVKGEWEYEEFGRSR